MAFAAFLILPETGSATVLRLDKAEAGAKETPGTAAPLPKLKPTPRVAPPPEAQTSPYYELTFIDESGKPRHLGEFKGKLILLNLWATWCAPCVKEMPSLSQLQQDYGDKGLTVVTLSQDEDIQKVKDFYSQGGISNLPVFLDQQMKVFQALGVQGLPFTMLIDATGKEVIQFSGFVDWHAADARTMLESHLPKPAAPSI